MKISEVMSKQVVKVTSVAMLPEVAQKMRQENIGVIPVEDDGQLVGVVTDRDITVNAVAKGKIDCQVKDVMSKSPATIDSNATVDEALQKMLHHKVRRLPVLDAQKKLVGLISLEDLTEAGDTQQLIMALKQFHQQTRHG